MAEKKTFPGNTRTGPDDISSYFIEGFPYKISVTVKKIYPKS